MKYIIKILPLFFLMISSCVAQKQSASFDELKYEAITRGSSYTINVKDNQVVYKTMNGEKTFSLSEEQLNKLNQALNAINLDKLESYEAPTDDRKHDGALHATIKVVKEEIEYMSTTFDDGYPPSELKELVDLLMSFTKK